MLNLSSYNVIPVIINEFIILSSLNNSYDFKYKLTNNNLSGN